MEPSVYTCWNTNTVKPTFQCHRYQSFQEANAAFFSCEDFTRKSILHSTLIDVPRLLPTMFHAWYLQRALSKRFVHVTVD